MEAEISHMEKIKNIVDEYISKTEQDVIDYASRIYFLISNNSEISILSLVEALSKFLTNENVEVRFKGTQILVEYLHCCQPGDLNDLENETLMLFFCDRLHDHHSVQPLVVYGFLALLSHQNVNNELVIKMTQSLFAEVHVQSMTQSDRRNVFNLFSVLLTLKLDVLKRIAADFVLGFIQAMDSERDPRNLLVCFANSYTVLRELDTSLFTEDFFEVLSCYFPIDFTPPKDDQFEITKEDLVLSLRKCLTCCKDFAPYAIPLFVEKLSSDVVGAKLDSLLTFTVSLAAIPPSNVEIFAKDVWMLIRKDVLLSEETRELKEPYENFIKAFIQCLLKSKNKEPLYNLVDQLATDCLQSLKDPEMTIAVPCGELILTISKLSSDLFGRILGKVLLPIETALLKYSSSSQRSSIFEIVLRLLQAIETMEKFQDSKSARPLAGFVDKHLSMIYSFLYLTDSIQLQCLGLKSLTEIVKRQKYFEGNSDLLSQHVFKMVFSNPDVHSKDVFADLKHLVAILSKENPELVHRDFVTPLTAKTLQENLLTMSNGVFEQCLQLLYPCCAHFGYFGKSVLCYLIKIVFESMDVAQNEDIFKIATKCCSDILKNCDTENTVDQSIVIQPLIQQLFLMNLQQAVSLDIFNGLISVLSSSFHQLSFDQQKNIVSATVEILQRNDVPGLVNWVEVPKREETIISQVAALLCTGILSQMSKAVLKDVQCDRLLDILWENMKVNYRNGLVVEQLGLCMASLVNKSEKGSDIPSVVFDMASKNLACNESSTSLAAVDLLSWVTKACVLNWREQITKESIGSLVACLINKTTGSRASKGFQMLTRDEIHVLTKESNAVIKLMYKQRFSQLVLPLLVDAYNINSDAAVKACLITSISCTLQVMPKQLLQRHLKELMPLLMHSFVTCDNDDILLSTITTLSNVLDQNKGIVEEHVGTLVSRLLSLVLHPKMNVRIMVLKCLTYLSSYPSYKVIPMKPKVVRKLSVVLDDRKRLVRKEAIRCSNSWHLMDS